MTRIVCSQILVLFIAYSLSGQAIRSIDGSFNNVFNPEWGSNGDQVVRITEVGYEDEISSIAGSKRPNPRHISNVLFSQDGAIEDIKNLSDFVWVFGQFIDHDITKVVDDHAEPQFIQIPSDDKVFSPDGPPIPLFRSQALRGTGTDKSNPREYFNSITAFIDASAVYGSEESRANWLRTFNDGKLKTSNGNNLPWNTLTGEFNDPIDSNAPHMDNPIGLSTKMYVAGDSRANENPLLASFHTLFVREHNRLCEELKSNNPEWGDEQLYQIARKWNGSFIQSIVYNEWLPAMGITLPNYQGYRDNLNPQIFNVFSAAAFRVGHTLINSDMIRIDSDGDEVPAGSISLKDSYFNPSIIVLAGGIEPYLRGMATQVQQKMDCKVIDDVRNFLFGAPSAGGLDLAAINIFRGRERGLPDYNTIRSNFGLPRIKTFDEITKHPEVAFILKELYSSVDNIDPWVGMLSEDYMPDAILGSSLMQIIEKQFQVLRDGDRFYFETDRYFDDNDKSIINSTTLHSIVMRNTGIDIMQQNVFEAMPIEMLNRGPEIDQQSLAAEVYPNPTSGPAEIKIFAEESFNIDLTIYDMQGRRISHAQHELESGNNYIPLELGNELAGSFYNIVVQRDELNYKIIRLIKD